MKLQRKKTYQTMLGTQDQYLRRLGKTISINIRNEVLCFSLFARTPNEVHRLLSRNKPVAIDWNTDNGNYLSIWDRIESSRKELGLDRRQAIELFGEIIGNSFHELEPAIATAQFQLFMGLSIPSLDCDESKQTHIDGYLLSVDPYNTSKPIPVLPVFDDLHYTPCSSQHRYITFDKNSFRIVRRAYGIAISNAEKNAILTNWDVSSIGGKLRSLRNQYVATLLLQPTPHRVRYLQDYLVSALQYDVSKYDDTDREENIDLSVSPLWHRALTYMGIVIVRDYVVYDLIEATDSSRMHYSPFKELDIFNDLLSSHLNELGQQITYNVTSNNLGTISKNYDDVAESNATLNLPDAIELAYLRAYIEMTKTLAEEITLLTIGDKDHPIHALIPTATDKKMEATHDS